MQEVECDILIVGGSLGGVAAALRAGRLGASVQLVERSSWIGGQLTGQGVCKPDDNDFVDTTGSTRAYREFRQRVRRHYTTHHRLSARGQGQQAALFNPGGDEGGFSAEPRVALQILQEMLAEPERDGVRTIQVHYGWQLGDISMDGNHILSVSGSDAQGRGMRFLPRYVLDATDLGDLLHHVGTQGEDWVLGAESRSETHEPRAPDTRQPLWVQPITVPIALERRPDGEEHRIPKPTGYDAIKAEQQFTIQDGSIDHMFAPGENMWEYRRFIAAANFEDPAFPCDLSMLNTNSNDFQRGVLPADPLDPSADGQTIQDAGTVTLAYLYWLQNECPRDEDNRRQGYPQLKMRPDVFNSQDGLAPLPYARESRRIRALQTVYEQDIAADYNPGPRACLFADSCGIGAYALDIHGRRALRPGQTAMKEIYVPTRPFQIPLGALIPVRLANLLAACKNLGVTHLTGGAYRLHPVEWGIGEAAGALAVLCCERNLEPQLLYRDPVQRRALQCRLLRAGVPLFWWSDVPDSHPAFLACQILGLEQVFTGGDDLRFQPAGVLTQEAKRALEQRMGRSLPWPPGVMTRADAAIWLLQELELGCCAQEGSQEETAFAAATA